MADKFVRTNKLRRDLALVLLFMLGLVSAVFMVGSDGPVARGQAMLGLLVSLIGMVVANAVPIVEEVR